MRAQQSANTRRLCAGFPTKHYVIRLVYASHLSALAAVQLLRMKRCSSAGEAQVHVGGIWEAGLIVVISDVEPFCCHTQHS